MFKISSAVKGLKLVLQKSNGSQRGVPRLLPAMNRAAPWFLVLQHIQMSRNELHACRGQVDLGPRLTKTIAPAELQGAHRHTAPPQAQPLPRPVWGSLAARAPHRTAMRCLLVWGWPRGTTRGDLSSNRFCF